MSSIMKFVNVMLSDSTPTFGEALDALSAVPVQELSRPGMLHHHVLGFVQSRIATVDGRELRIHHWPAGARFAEEPHTHLWELTSYVLAGSMRSLTYTVEPSRSDTLFQLYSVKQLDSGTIREPLEANVTVLKIAEETHARGSIYTVPQGAFHTSEPSSSSALTLIITGRATAPRPHVAVARDSDPARFGRAPMTPPSDQEVQEFRSALEQVTS